MEGSSSEELNDESIWAFYRDREEWKDVEPVPQDDGPDPVVAIAYSDKFEDVYDYFRAVLLRGEKSERALLLTVDALELNPANYTVWQYRRDLLKELNKNLVTEMVYSKQMVEDNPKNYQVWHHRRMIVEWYQDPSQELKLTELILEQDAKNYHAWQHRQWIIRTFKLFDQELEYVEKLLDEDIRNNSAWNQRYFVINNTTGFTPDVVEREITFTLGKIELAALNESAWNYLRGLVLHHDKGLCCRLDVVRFCENLFATGNRSPYLLGFLVEICEDNLEKKNVDTHFSLERALKLCDDLANEYDKIRSEYWKFTARCLSAYYEGSEDASLSKNLVTELS